MKLQQGNVLHVSVILFTGTEGSLCQEDPTDRDTQTEIPQTETPQDREHPPDKDLLPWTETPRQRPPRQRPQTETARQRPFQTETTPIQRPLQTETPLPLYRNPSGQRPPWTEIPPDRNPPGQRPLPRTETPPTWTEIPAAKRPPRQRPTWTDIPQYGNERAVCILLECILVFNIFDFFMT